MTAPILLTQTPQAGHRVLSAEALPRPQVRGKFLFCGDQKVSVRGVTYGTFRPDQNGQEHSPELVGRDFARMAAAGLNAVRTYTVPPSWLLDVAAKYGLWVLVGLPWEGHVDFLAEQDRACEIANRIQDGVRMCAGHPAVLGYAIGNEIPSSIVRWCGPRRVERFLNRLYWAAKDADPEGLVTYVNYPSTEYLDLPFLDFVSFNVYLETPESFRAYLARLQIIAGDRPLLMAEIGLDSRRHGEENQARALVWQIRQTFASGCAGAFVFAWTDTWYRGGHDVEDWDFGLTDRNWLAKPALAAVSKAFADAPFPSDLSWPRISVVVCTYNGERTLGDCLAGLRELRYPDYEVIVVDDGSTDETASIAESYPEFQLIRTENRGLSNARNTGLAAASGRIVAYLDDDARPDPDWLSYLALSFQTADHVGVGGPNIPPPGDGLIAECVANAPGGPIHVLLSDSEAEHIPGCNMAFLKENLEAVGGFDSQFRVAGDDVDICWRLQQRGWTLGFSPSAVVWHHRRNSVGAYWKQQKGYAKAEVLLRKKWPEKYNLVGHARWAGRVYNKGLAQALGLSRGRIYQGTWGTAPFQSIHYPKPRLWELLPIMPEWYLIIAGLAILAALGLSWHPLVGFAGLLPLAIGTLILQAAKSASRATFSSTPPAGIQRLKLLALTACLHLLQPMARLVGRLPHDLAAWGRTTLEFALPWPRTITFWREHWRALVDDLHDLEMTLQQSGVCVLRGSEYDRWDLEVRGGLFGALRVRSATEEHGAGRQLVRWQIWPRCSFWWLILTAFFVALGVGAGRDQAWVAAVVLELCGGLLLLRIVADCAAATARVIAGLTRTDLGTTEVHQQSFWKSFDSKRQMITRLFARASRRVAGAGDGSNSSSDGLNSTKVGISSMTYFRRILPYVRPYWWLGVVSALTTILTSLAGLASPWPLKLLVDNVISGQPLPPIVSAILGPLSGQRPALLLIVVVSGLGLALAQSGLNVVSNYANTTLHQKIVLDFRCDMLRHAQRLSVAYHDQVSTGRLMYGINFEADAAGGMILAIQPLVESALTIVGMIWILVRIDPLLALISLTIVPILYYSVGYYANRIQPDLMTVKGTESDALSIIHETMQMVRVITAFRREEHENQRYYDQGNQAVEGRVKLTVRQTVFSLVVSMTTAFGTALVMGFGAWHALNGELTTGDLLVVISYVAAVYKPLESISYTIGSLQDRFVGLQMAFHIFDTEPAIQEIPEAVHVDRTEGRVTFESVSFSYPGRVATLQDITFEVQPGQVVAVVGPTGAGKTTLMSLLIRFYDPNEGRILLDGIDLRHLSLDSLRSQISLVPQEPLLFSSTIADNIRYGRLDASFDEIVQAAKDANAHDFVMNLPEGYETSVGERGVQLSGGERQRICVARAFLKDAPILILDEPTSSIDSRTEAVILDALDRLMVGRTTFVIAHRLSTVRHADLILTIDGGRLVEHGTHDELLQLGGLYKQLYDVQIGQARQRRRLQATVLVGEAEDAS